MKAFLIGIGVAFLAAVPLRAEQAPPAEAQPRPVITEIIASESNRLRSFPGVVAAEVQSVLAFQTTGRIATRTVEAGDRVSAGDTLATLDQITLAEDVAAAQAALEAATGQAELAAQSLRRVEELQRRGAASMARYESALAERDSAVAAEAAATADLARARDAERYGTLTAPADGVVISVSAEPGTIVTPGTPIMTLAAEDRLEVIVDVSSDVLAILPKDAQFAIHPRILIGAAATGHLRLIEPVVDSSTRSHRLRLTLQGVAPTIRIGSLVTATLDTPDQPVVTVPRIALRETPEGPMVWRVTAPDRRAQSVAVTLGVALEARVIVTGGLNPGDEILVRGVNSVTEGQVLGERLP
jgi:RND family efflux transporter MFP subunit